jgi:hypothetical protein
MEYPGGKNAGGTYHRIINQMPPHRIYVEPFLGSGAILRLKRPAEINIGIDRDPGAIAAIAGMVPPGTQLLIGDGIDWLGMHGRTLPMDAMVYCDPPYLGATRDRYLHKMMVADHQKLLAILQGLCCRVLISGYDSSLYAADLADWDCVRFDVVNRGGGMSTEVLWRNYPEPDALHDYRYLGDNCRERENIRRQQRRWCGRLAAMGRLKRLALLSVLHHQSAETAVVATIGESGVPVRHGENGDSARVSGKLLVRFLPDDSGLASHCADLDVRIRLILTGLAEGVDRRQLATWLRAAAGAIERKDEIARRKALRKTPMTVGK